MSAASIYQSFKKYIREHELFSDGDRVILGVSGGADSIGLMTLMCSLAEEMPLSITVLHVNHMLRGEEADGDEEFVKKYCEDCGVKCVGVHADVKTYAFRKNISIEEAGREARYQAFRQLAQKLIKDDESTELIKVAVAHHSDDNAETILLNIIRGSDLKGLQGMQPVTERDGLTIVRPMLCLSREEIEEYLNEQKIGFRTDSTNMQDEFARNKIRLNVLPELKKINPKAAAHINETAKAIRKTKLFMDGETARAYALTVDESEDGLNIDLERFRIMDPVLKSAVIYECAAKLAGSVKDIGNKHVAAVLALADKQTGRRVQIPYNIIAIKSYSRIIMRLASREDLQAQNMVSTTSLSPDGRLIEPEPEHQLLIDIDDLSYEPVYYDLWNSLRLAVKITEVNSANRQRLMEKNKYTKAFDFDKIKGNLVLKKPQNSDEISFFGGRKTVKKFFVDQKVPQEERRNALVLRDDHEVLWILGHRISETFKITDFTAHAIEVSISGGNYEQH